MSKPLYKAVVVIWCEDDPMSMELSDLAREAESGSALCTGMKAKIVEDPDKDPDWDGNWEFFGEEEEEE